MSTTDPDCRTLIMLFIIKRCEAPALPCPAVKNGSNRAELFCLGWEPFTGVSAWCGRHLRWRDLMCFTLHLMYCQPHKWHLMERKSTLCRGLCDIVGFFLWWRIRELWKRRICVRRSDKHDPSPQTCLLTLHPTNNLRFQWGFGRSFSVSHLYRLFASP